MTRIKRIEEKISKFSPKLLKNLNNYIDGMIIKPQKKKTRKSKRHDFKWEGALKHLRDRYTSVELQKEINKLR